MMLIGVLAVRLNRRSTKTGEEIKHYADKRIYKYNPLNMQHINVFIED